MFAEMSIPLAVILAACIVSLSVVAAALIVARALRAQQSFLMGDDAPYPPPPSSMPPEALPVEPSGIAINANTRLTVGTRVLADWNGIWWRAEVIALEQSGRVKIHYVGWDNSWDETVPRSRLQVDLSESLGNG